MRYQILYAAHDEGQAEDAWRPREGPGGPPLGPVGYVQLYGR